MHRTQNSWSLSSNFITRYHVNNVPTYAHTQTLDPNTFSDVVNVLPAIIGFARTWLQLLIPMLLFDYYLYVYGFMFHFGIKTFNTFILSFRSMFFFLVCVFCFYLLWFLGNCFISLSLSLPLLFPGFDCLSSIFYYDLLTLLTGIFSFDCIVINVDYEAGWMVE